MTPLRVCRVCGLAAHTEADLEVFKKDKESPYGRAHLCKKCRNAYRKERGYNPVELIEVFRARSSDGLVWCHFCNEEITKLEGQDKESLAIHSLDGDHKNWSPENKVPTHNHCHSRHHMTGEKNSNWKGGITYDLAKYMRKWRARRRAVLPGVLDAKWVDKEGWWEVSC